MSLIEMPQVTECAVDGCAFNHDGCHAPAITVRSQQGTAGCGTFFDISTKGGLDRVVGQVGACERTDCSFNKDLTCTAGSVRVGPGHDVQANCLTYTTA
ncbi:DUF1540 domain-containing protein [Pseudokineococcus lusitanus]|jgi:hypothetical protein|uniref:Uncharacterized protein DUF1540 n=1 Tax=Pseudokineococcus lusitanus TaxID=763993 RepID=A0A3N1HT57_9ACTN|nr:DUF1540 domain-containing protein [Pseudokineococcus lusitanus]ROP45659.1 uncharacterized protein DUF1540 [Pseudokineococcus lusitanus]